MRKENVLLVLWIIFGFLCITAIDAVLSFIIHLIYFSLSEFGISYGIMKVIVPITALILYGLTTFILIKRINVKSKKSSIDLIEFPKNLTILLVVIAFGLSPITNKLSGLYAERISRNENIKISEYLDFHGWLYVSLGLSQLLVILSLLILFLIKLKTIKKS